MPSLSLHLTPHPRRSANIPQSLTQRAMVLGGLASCGAIDRLGKRLQIRRQGGTRGLDVFCCLSLLFAGWAAG